MISLTSEYFPPIGLNEIAVLFEKKGMQLTQFLKANHLKTKKIGRTTYVSTTSLLDFIETLPKTAKEHERRIIQNNIRLAKENKLLSYAALVLKMRKANKKFIDLLKQKGAIQNDIDISINLDAHDLFQIEIDPIGYGLSYSEVKRIILDIRNTQRPFINTYESIKEKIESIPSAA